jgi:hypothetical protein
VELAAGFAWLTQRSALRPAEIVGGRSHRDGRKPSPTWEIHPDLEPQAVLS